MMAGLEHTTDGDIVNDNKRVNDLAPVKRGNPMVFQSYALYPHMTVFENLAFPLRNARASAADIRKKVDVTLRADMRIELTSLHKQLRITMIYITHDQVEAMTMADLIVVLNEGTIAQVGGPEIHR